MLNDKCSILISIHPNFVSSMRDGSKLYEYRKRIPHNTKRLVIYATVPVKAIVAIAEVTEVLREEPRRLWDKTKHGSGIKYSFFMDYFRNNDMGYALKLGQIQWLDSHVCLDLLKPDMRPPQSFQYISDAHIDLVKRYGAFVPMRNHFLSRFLSEETFPPEASQFAEAAI